MTDVSYPELEGRIVRNGYIGFDTSEEVDVDNIERYMVESPLASAQRFDDSIHDIAEKFEGIVAVVSHFDIIARGVEFLQCGENGEFTIAELEKTGGYLLDRGQFVVIHVSSSGFLEGKIYKNPHLQTFYFCITKVVSEEKNINRLEYSRLMPFQYIHSTLT